MSNNGLGDTTTDYIAVTVEGSSDADTSAISAGDAVALDQAAGDGRFPTAIQLIDDTTPDKDQEFGVAAEDIADGDNGTVVVDGGVIANVATGVSQGARAGAGTTAGQLASVDDGPIRVLSNEGGTDRSNTNLAANEAEVLL